MASRFAKEEQTEGVDRTRIFRTPFPQNRKREAVVMGLHRKAA